MKLLLNYLRQKPELYIFFRKFYGKTIGFHWLKKRYVKRIGLWNGKNRIKLINDKNANKIISKNINSKKTIYGL